MRNSTTVDYNLDTRAEWMLRLLCTSDDSGVTKPISGRTRLVKAIFLLHRNLQEHFDEDAGYKFEAYKYGPFDKGVYEAAESLERKKLISITTDSDHSKSQEAREYKPTRKGKKLGDELINDISSEQKRLLKWVRYKQASKSLGSLLSYVYTKYPDMTTESEIADRVS